MKLTLSLVTLAYLGTTIAAPTPITESLCRIMSQPLEPLGRPLVVGCPDLGFSIRNGTGPIQDSFKNSFRDLIYSLCDEDQVCWDAYYESACEWSAKHQRPFPDKMEGTTPEHPEESGESYECPKTAHVPLKPMGSRPP